MHENLKYTLKLDKNIEPFVSFKNKDPKNPNDRAEISDWQAIYADNKYGTHYLLYAKFLGENTEEGFEVEKIQIYVQNYRGFVSIGLGEYATIAEMTIDEHDPDRDNRYPDRKKYYLQVALKGINKSKSTYSFKPEKLILKDGDIIMTQPIFIPIESTLTKIFDKEDMKNSDFLDELFMARLGSDVFITAEGIDRLNELFALGLVDKVDVDQIDDNSKEKVKYSSSAVKNYALKFTRPYPCIPIYSVCEIKK
jgi:hypothetical protein